MKKTIIRSAQFLGCVNGSEPGEETTIDIPVTSVQVYLWSKGSETPSPYTGDGEVIYYSYDGRKNKGLVYGGAGTITNGKLTLKLPAAVEDQYLEPIGETFDASLDKGSITVSPGDAKVFSVYGFDIIKNEESAYRLYYEKYDDVSEDYIAYIYSSTEVTVTGSVTEIEDKGTQYAWTRTYNLKLKKGWNAVYLHEYWDEDDNTSGDAITTDGSGIPSGLKWVLKG
ncbi:MAG: hypothetical protein LBP81_02560 [Treponema sp.]|jgi:hypothetical protein|nr:hypothetical protein [Treponema sp.]